MNNVEMADHPWRKLGELEEGSRVKVHVDDGCGKGTMRREAGPKVYHYTVCRSVQQVPEVGAD